MSNNGTMGVFLSDVLFKDITMGIPYVKKLKRENILLNKKLSICLNREAERISYIKIIDGVNNELRDINTKKEISLGKKDDEIRNLNEVINNNSVSKIIYSDNEKQLTKKNKRLTVENVLLKIGIGALSGFTIYTIIK